MLKQSQRTLQGQWRLYDIVLNQWGKERPLKFDMNTSESMATNVAFLSSLGVRSDSWRKKWLGLICQGFLRTWIIF
jgi:hypothetical protein